MPPCPEGIRNQDCVRLPVLISVGVLGFSCTLVQLSLMREMLGTFNGNELVLGILLGNWLLLTALGAWLGSHPQRHPVPVFIGAFMLIALVPLAQIAFLRVGMPWLFLRGAVIGLAPTAIVSLGVLLPFCIVSGFLLTFSCSLLDNLPGNVTTVRPGLDPGILTASPIIGNVYLADCLGSIAGGVLFSFFLVRRYDHFALLCFPAAVNLAVAGGLALRFGRTRLAAGSAGLLLGLFILAILQVDAILTDWQHPRQRVLFRGNSPYGRLIVTESAGQLNFLQNGLPIASSRDLENAEETVHYAMAQRPGAKKVLLISGAISGGCRELLKYRVSEIVCAELDPLIIEAGRQFLPETLLNPRITLANTDGRLLVKQNRRQFDLVLVDLPNPSNSQLNRFFTLEFFQEAKQALVPNGVLSVSLTGYHNYVSPEFGRLLGCAYSTLKQTFQNIRVLPGGRVFLLASDGDLSADIASQLEASRVPTKLINRHYLEAVFSPDRINQVKQAASVPALVNEDFNPVMYYYHQLFWSSQFQASQGWWTAGGTITALFFLLRPRRVTLVVFASGFASTALEVVLLLGFQILYGSLYQQLGIIVTLFMTGLASGAWLANRTTARQGRVELTWIAWAIAGIAALLPMILKGLASTGTAPSSLLLVQVSIPALTFLLATLVGAEFPLASRLEVGDTARTASKIYTADLAGACAGAFLVSAGLIPLLGVPAVCWITAGLNLAGGAAVAMDKESHWFTRRLPG